MGPIGKIGLQGSLTYKIFVFDVGPRSFNSEVKFAFIRTSINNKNSHLEINTNNLSTFLIEIKLNIRRKKIEVCRKFCQNLVIVNVLAFLSSAKILIEFQGSCLKGLFNWNWSIDLKKQKTDQTREIALKILDYESTIDFDHIHHQWHCFGKLDAF